MQCTVQRGTRLSAARRSHHLFQSGNGPYREGGAADHREPQLAILQTNAWVQAGKVDVAADAEPASVVEWDEVVGDGEQVGHQPFFVGL